MKTKKTFTEIVNSKGFLVAMLIIFSLIILAVIVAIVVLSI
nr:hypothetical protein [Mycoplasmopsis bovis]